jgi:hypothetical protein
VQPIDPDTTRADAEGLDLTPVRRRHRFQRRLRRAERRGMPTRLAPQDAPRQLLAEPLEAVWDELGERRADWFRARRRRFIVPGVVLHVLNFGMLVLSLGTPGPSPAVFNVAQITVAAAAAWCAALCGFGFPYVPAWVRSPHQYLSHHSRDLLDAAPSMRHLAAIAPSDHGWWAPVAPFTDTQLLAALAGFTAIGRFDGTPAAWIDHRTLGDELEAFTLLGYHGWLAAADLDPAALEVYQQLLGEYDGTLGELVATSRSLGE